MNISNTMIILKGQPKDDVKSYTYDKTTNKYIVTFENGKTYSYISSNFEFIDFPKEVDTNIYKFANAQGTVFSNIEKVLLFKGKQNSFYRMFFSKSKVRSYKQEDLIIDKNVISNNKIKDYLNYLNEIADIVGLKNKKGESTLGNQFKKLSFIDEKSVLAMYINGAVTPNDNNLEKSTVIFPFGSNFSQINAVNNAMNNKISLIEGPPGTGKTQTILNILANIIIRGKTVAIVSNNNSATANVFEKMDKYGFGYIGAQLGSLENKKEFISSKQTKYPDFKTDILTDDGICNIQRDVSELELKLVDKFLNDNKKANLKQELSSLITEKEYFDRCFDEAYNGVSIFRNIDNLKSEKLLKLWVRYQQIIEQDKKVSLIFKIEGVLFYGINDFKVFKRKAHDIITILKKNFYDVKIKEIKNEISNMEHEQNEFLFKEKISELSDKSLSIFRHYLAMKYKAQGQRKEFSNDDLWEFPKSFLEEYPVILSTTHSAMSSLKDIMYDYIIVDEASQVDLVTGALAMSVAKNIIVVGDLKQLSNVISGENKEAITSISIEKNINNRYKYENHSLLSSLCDVFEDAPKTLLKEHYRCHPKIINFCNQKFYNNQLVIMTKDNYEDDVLQANITTKGNHARGHFNQRQIDEIKQKILPELQSDDIGIITPYRKQTEALDKELKELEIDVSTVHKFQGREKDDIIISTVDNVISSFTDNQNMLNVAVSRAKNRLRVVVSDNEKNENTNIGELIKYIEYNNFEIKKSDIYSVFDMLYKSYENERKRYLSKYKKVSQYDSENLMYSLICEILSKEEFSKFEVLSHQPLNTIIRDTTKLTKVEENYALNPLTHIDFLIYNTIDKSMVLAIEVDGFHYHRKGTDQSCRDDIKNEIFEKYSIPMVRFNTTGSNEQTKIEEKLLELLRKN